MPAWRLKEVATSIPAYRRRALAHLPPSHGKIAALRTHAGLLIYLRWVPTQSIAIDRETTSDIGWRECNNELPTSGCIQSSQPDLSPAVPKPCDWSARSGMARTIRTFVSWHFGRMKRSGLGRRSQRAH